MSTERNRLIELCAKGMTEKGLAGTQYQDRLKLEIREINAQNEHEYILDLHDKLKSERKRYPENQPNLLIYHLLDIAPAPDMGREPVFDMGEYPDIDVDFIKPVQSYLKDVWAPATFGRDKVCSIGNYTTFGIKSAFIDMARIFGCDHNEILSLTTKLGLKDEDGNTLTFDKALEEHPELNAYCERNPEVAKAVKKCLNRNRGMGKHAGGLIISKSRIDDLVPLVKDTDGAPLSAWVEGLHGQDLGPMGLIKFDVLVTTNLLQIAECVRLIKERHGLDYICSDPAVNRDWSDSSYIDDELALSLANKGDLLGVFQFDSPGIRQLCRGNVDSFDDLVAYNALYRPGPLNANMHTTYIKRKRGEEKYEIHPKLEAILGPTYGIFCYQETIMRMLDVIGDIPPKDCLVVLKGISKKQIEKFRKYKDMFVANGQKNLGISEEEILKIWQDIEGFASYSFNKSHSCAYAYLAMRCLWLKAHYPIEFFTATLKCEKSTEKIKEYMIDARSRGIPIEPINVNKSKENFAIGTRPDGQEAIYYGFSKLKGLGAEVSRRVVENQQYESFEDFLKRFGTDAKVVPPLIGLGAFGARNRVDMFKFYEHYKSHLAKAIARDVRHEVSKQKQHEKMRELVYRGVDPSENIPVGFSDDHYEIYEKRFADDPVKWKEIVKLHESYFRSVENYAKKRELNELPVFDDFQADLFELDPKWEQLLLEPVESAERLHYGFRWTHPLENSPDYNKDELRTFYAHRAAVEEGEMTNYVEVELLKVQQKPTKTGGVYYSVLASDVVGEENRINIWEDDYAIFQDMLVEGNLVKMLLDAPDNGFPSYKLNGPPRWARYKLPHKSMDFRVVVYRKTGEEFL
jgi:DNA polymerase III alpha subunit